MSVVMVMLSIDWQTSCIILLDMLEHAYGCRGFHFWFKANTKLKTPRYRSILWINEATFGLVNGTFSNRIPLVSFGSALRCSSYNDFLYPSIASSTTSALVTAHFPLIAYSRPSKSFAVVDNSARISSDHEDASFNSPYRLKTLNVSPMSWLMLATRPMASIEKLNARDCALHRYNRKDLLG